MVTKSRYTVCDLLFKWDQHMEPGKPISSLEGFEHQKHGVGESGLAGYRGDRCLQLAVYLYKAKELSVACKGEY